MTWWWSNDRKLSPISWIIKYCCLRLNKNIFCIFFKSMRITDSASHRWIKNYTLDSKCPSSFCTKSHGRRQWTITALRCNHVTKVEMSLAHSDCHNPSACGCVGSVHGAPKQVTVTICCYFNNTYKSSTCLSYSFRFMIVRSNGNDCLLLDRVTFRDEIIRRLSQPFRHTDDRSQSPMAFLLLQQAIYFTFVGKTNDAVSPCYLRSLLCWNCLVQ